MSAVDTDGPQKKQEETERLKKELEKARNAKLILYASLKKLASDLKDSQTEKRRTQVPSYDPSHDDLFSTTPYNGSYDQAAPNYGSVDTKPNTLDHTAIQKPAPATTKQAPTPSTPAEKPHYWYSGGIIRPPSLLPSAANTETLNWRRPPVSLTDLFLDLAVVTALSRVGDAVQNRGTVDGPILAYFFVFWSVWAKATAFGTRFDTSDLGGQVSILTSCVAVLFGSLSTTGGLESEDGTRIMEVGLAVSAMHFLIHWRIWAGWRKRSDDEDGLRNEAVVWYAGYVMAMTAIESATWFAGIFFLNENSGNRKWVFLVAILSSLRTGKTRLPYDFYSACSKRGVLFILLLGFTLQNIVMVATPFFDYQIPGWGEYIFMALACFLLFCIKLLYVDDSFSVDPVDHALLVNDKAAFFFHTGQLCLLLSTTVLGAGLNLITHSYLAAATALPANAKNLVCGGFSAVIFSVGFIKSMHLRRVPTNTAHKRLFLGAYGTQLFVTIAVIIASAAMCLDGSSQYPTIFFGRVYFTETQTLGILCGFGSFLVAISWMDELVELSIYDELAEARIFRVEPFGIWACLKISQEPGLKRTRSSLSQLRRASQASFYSGSSASMSGSKMSLYAAIGDGTTGGNVGGDRGSTTDRHVKFKPTTSANDNPLPGVNLVV